VLHGRQRRHEVRHGRHNSARPFALRECTIDDAGKIAVERDDDFDAAGLRDRYKELAKRLHPDSTGGDKAAEERMKDINRAYSLLRKRMAGSAPANGPMPARAAAG